MNAAFETLRNMLVFLGEMLLVSVRI
jgi:hypothetical protein